MRLQFRLVFLRGLQVRVGSREDLALRHTLPGELGLVRTQALCLGIKDLFFVRYARALHVKSPVAHVRRKPNAAKATGPIAA